MTDEFSTNGAKQPPDTDKQRLLNEVEQALNARHTPERASLPLPVLDDLVNTIPTADSGFQNTLEARLVDALAQAQQAQAKHQLTNLQETSDMQNVMQFTHTHTTPHRIKPRTQRLQLAIVAGLLMTLIGVGLMITLSQLPNNEPPSAAGFGAAEQSQDDDETSVITATPTFVPSETPQSIINATATFTPTATTTASVVPVIATPTMTATFTATPDLESMAQVPIPQGYALLEIAPNRINANGSYSIGDMVLMEYVYNGQRITLSRDAVIVGMGTSRGAFALIALPPEDVDIVDAMMGAGFILDFTYFPDVEDGSISIPPGMRGIYIQATALMQQSRIMRGDRVNILAALLIVENVDGEFQALQPVDTSDALLPNQWQIPLSDADAIGDNAPQLTIQQIIADSIVLDVEYLPDDPTTLDTVALAVSPQDVVILQWLIDAETPLALIHAD